MKPINIFMDDMRPGPMGDAGWGANLTDWMSWVIVRSIENVKQFLEMGIVDQLSLDHDMGIQDTGYDLVKWMAEHEVWPKGQIWIHSANPVGVENMVATVNRYHPNGIKAIVGEPFDILKE